MAKLKVFGGNSFEMVDGRRTQVRAIVAATSQKAAAEIVGETLSYFRGWWSETWNDIELEIAMRSPGVVFHASSTNANDYRPRAAWQRETTMQTLEPCPFCGGKAHWPEPEVNINFVGCTECGAATNNADAWNSRASHDPATPADKAPADLVPVAYLDYATVAHLREKKERFERFMLATEYVGNFTAPLYGPEAAERIAALDEARAEQWRMRRETEAQRDLEKSLADTFRDERDEAVKRAETAEAKEAQLRAALTYARRFLNPVDHDVAYVDAALAQKEGE